MAKKDHSVADEQPPAAEEDIYKILGVDENATPEAIKSAYKKSALKHHPGRTSNFCLELAQKAKT